MEILKSNMVIGVAAALAATVLAPVFIPVIGMAARPLTKSLLKGGVLLYEKGRETVAGAGEAVEDMIAEVRSELERRPGERRATEDEDEAGAASQFVDKRMEGDSDRGTMEREPGIPPQPGNGAQV